MKSPTTRQEQFITEFPHEKPFRWKQIEQALYDPAISEWNDISTLAKPLRESLSSRIPWISCIAIAVYESINQDTFKAILETIDNKRFESVLMKNKRGQWTICVSSQIGCAMGCTFCATGTMGLTRSLSSDEIADQYRFWVDFLNHKPELSERISNVVFMGMGEPLANYENVKSAIHTWLSYTDMGPTKITVSSVGIIAQLERILQDPEWPGARIAISLHSANEARRKEIVPSSIPNFLVKLAEWTNKYQEILGNRQQYVTFEYTLINEVNDTPELAHELATYMHSTGARKINVIPYNPVSGKQFSRSQQERIDVFKHILRDQNIDVTQRKTMGDDIAAACGQLVTEGVAKKTL